MKYLLSMFLMYLLVLFPVLSFAEPLGEIIMKIETAAEQLFFVTVRIEVDKIDNKGKNVKGIGTGFIVGYKWSNKEGLFLVTNKHVVKNAKKGRFFFIQSDGKNPLLGKTFNIEVNNFKKSWFSHPDDKIDVAIMPLAKILAEIQKRNVSVFFKSISRDLLPTLKQEESFDALEEVVFVGYPSGIFDTVNYIPVARRGTTATPFNIDYLGLPQFLVDASVFPGSSGSPVFILNKGSYSPRGGGLVVGNRLIFLGLISSVYTRNDEGIWDFVDVPTTLVPIVRTQQMVDLGIVIKSSTVFETIEEFLKSKGEIE